MNESIDSKASKQVKKRKVIANVLNTEYDVVKEVLEDVMGFKLSYEAESETSNTTKEWDLYWHDLNITPELLTKLRPYQKVNHFPGMEALYRKNLLAKNLNRMRKIYPEDYEFFPSTWILPFEWADFKRQFNGKNKTFIVKPGTGSQGKGIFLTRHWSNIDPEEHYVVQSYISNPYLIDHLKFDLRIYVLVYGCDPYRIFIHKEGLARFATEEYTAPKPQNLKNIYIHLTNYALNKDNENFEFNTEADNADTGHKRSLDSIWRYIKEHGGNPTQVKADIKHCIVKSFCSVQPHLAHMCRSCQPNDFENNKCFEILGFDILLDHNLKPWLLEVNHSPSFSTDTPFDYKVKAKLLEDTFRLLNLDANKRLKYHKDKSMFVVIKRSTMTREEKALKKANKMAKRDEYELNNMGDYELAYPDKEYSSLYDKFIKSATEFEFNIKKKGNFLPDVKTKGEKQIQNKTRLQVKSFMRRKNKSNITVTLGKQRSILSTSVLNNNYTIPERFYIRNNVQEFRLLKKLLDNRQKYQDISLTISKLRTPTKKVYSRKSLSLEAHKASSAITHKINIDAGIYIVPTVIDLTPGNILYPIKGYGYSANKWIPNRLTKRKYQRVVL